MYPWERYQLCGGRFGCVLGDYQLYMAVVLGVSMGTVRLVITNKSHTIIMLHVTLLSVYSIPFINRVRQNVLNLWHIQ